MDIRDAFFSELYKIARDDKDVILLTADMGAKKLDDFRKLPNQFFNMGVAEQNMINVATGLALSGKKVFCYAIAAFLVRRCLDQIKVNLVDMNLPVALIGVNPGNHYWWDGPTHCVEHDEEIMRAIGVKVIYNFTRGTQPIFTWDCLTYVRLCAGQTK